MSLGRHLVKPLVSENPITVQILGLCSALAVSRSLEPALIMAASVIGVLLFSNLAVSLLRHILPRSIRLILEVTLIASAVIVVDETLKAYLPGISEVLSVFVGLIITNCIILGRAEAFARKNGVVVSVADGLGMGLGFTAGLTLLGAVREFFGAGTLGLVFGDAVLLSEPFGFFQQAPGAFVALGLLLAIMNLFGRTASH
jgi:Na+-transporting NADH:ubiquinone oxidoreductase subunit D